MQAKNTDDFTARLESMLGNGQSSRPTREGKSKLGNDFGEIAEAWPYLMESERDQVISVVRSLRRR